MSKTRIIVTCPETGVVAITTIAYEDMIDQRKRPRFFVCPCGETHKLTFASDSALPQQSSPPLDHHCAS